MEIMVSSIREEENVSDFKISGNIGEIVNAQFGDHNTMNSYMEVQIDWNKVQKIFEEQRKKTGNNPVILECLDASKQKNKKKLKKIIIENLEELSKKIFTSLVSSALVEIFKVMI